MNKVCIIGGNGAYQSMFKLRGWQEVSNIKDADLVQFCGGADVNPALYGEEPHPKTWFNKEQDDYEQSIYEECIHHNIPMVGICRGGQFLNVMNDGDMWQHVDNHAIQGTHKVVDKERGISVQCTSTHHQMMVAGGSGVVLATASISTNKEYMHLGELSFAVEYELGEGEDVEVVWYEETKCLCFQPHPEMVTKGHDCQEYYFELIKDLFGLGE